MRLAQLKIVIILLLFNIPFGCDGGGSHTVVGPKANNIILFIGDGMGAEHRKAARWTTVGKNGKLSMDDMPANGWLQTHSADNSITDSAAASTAMSTGSKTNNGVIALDPNLNFLITILGDAKSQDKRVGLVTTTQITHATPAAFASHVADRNLMVDIAEQMLDTSVDVLLGGGENEFLPTSDNGCFPDTGKRSDGRNLINEAIDNNYLYVCDSVSFDLVEPSSILQLIGLFADEGMSRPFSPTLADMTQKAIDVLSQRSDGFFLMVESGQIDWASSDNDADNTIADTIALDEAVAVAKEFASISNDTLIIVTADHETGGMVVTSSSSGLSDEDGPFITPDGSLISAVTNFSSTDATSMPAIRNAWGENSIRGGPGS